MKAVAPITGGLLIVGIIASVKLAKSAGSAVQSPTNDIGTNTETMVNESDEPDDENETAPSVRTGTPRKPFEPNGQSSTPVSAVGEVIAVTAVSSALEQVIGNTASGLKQRSTATSGSIEWTSESGTRDIEQGIRGI